MVCSHGVLTLPHSIKHLHLPAPQLSLEISHVRTGTMKHYTSKLGTDSGLKSRQLSGSSNAMPFLFECPMSVDVMISTDYQFDKIFIWQEIGLWACLGGMILIRLAEVGRPPGLEPRVHMKKNKLNSNDHHPLLPYWGSNTTTHLKFLPPRWNIFWSCPFVPLAPFVRAFDQSH